MQCDVATSITSITRKDDPNVNSSESGKKSKSLRNWMDKLGRQILDSAVEGEREGGGERPLRNTCRPLPRAILPRPSANSKCGRSHSHASLSQTLSTENW